MNQLSPRRPPVRTSALRVAARSGVAAMAIAWACVVHAGFVNEYAASFAGNPAAKEHVLMSTSVNSTAPHTFSAWFKFSGSADGSGIVGSRDHFSPSGYKGTGIMIGGGGKLRYLLKDADETYDLYSTSAVNDGDWHHTACVFDGSTMYIWLDGASNNAMAADAVDTCLNGSSVGRSYAAVDGYYFIGSIDEVSVWDKALSPTEIGELFASTNTFDLATHSGSDNLQFWWRMGDEFVPATTTFPDQAGANDGTGHNMDSDNVSVDHAPFTATEAPGFTIWFH